MSQHQVSDFISHIQNALNSVQLLRLTLSKQRQKGASVKNVFIKLVQLKSGLNVSFLYRTQTQDITKNLSVADALTQILKLIQDDFLQGDLFTTVGEWHLLISQNKNGEKVHISHKKVQTDVQPELSHNKVKNRLIESENNIYLRELGVVTHEGKVKADKQDKFKQINKFIEVIETVLAESNLPNNPIIVDMGSGKGYLTFALCDYLSRLAHLQPQIIGVELRQNLVDYCNTLAQQVGFKQLSFLSGSIQNAPLAHTDMLIALHACDTATDDAIIRGIRSQASVIICAPCCHKQIRKQMNPPNVLSEVTQFGIMAERQSEIITDSLRALILESLGYKTKVFEFIATEHTPKNILIVAIKSEGFTEPNAQIIAQIQEIKALYGIKEHALEKIFHG